MKHWFTITIPDEIARTMTRKQYYAARSWCRFVRRTVMLNAAEEKLQQALRDLTMYGRAEYLLS